jgi:predicted transcriptional regulator
MEAMELKNRANFAKSYLEPALSEGYIEMTLPDSPTSKKQKYRLTKKGEKLKNEVFNEHE